MSLHVYVFTLLCVCFLKHKNEKIAFRCCSEWMETHVGRDDPRKCQESGEKSHSKGIILVSLGHHQQPEAPMLLSTGDIRFISWGTQSEELRHMCRATEPLSLGSETCPSLAGGPTTWHSGGSEAGRWGRWEVGVLLAGFASPLLSAMCVGFGVPVFYICQPRATCFPALPFPHGYPFTQGPFSVHSACLSPFASLAGACMNRPQGCKTFEQEGRAIQIPHL